MSAQVHRNALPSGYKLLWYRMEKVLGQGGFGITYLAWDGNLKIWVAIKEYLPIDRALRFRPADRPQTVAAWKALFPSLVADGWLPREWLTIGGVLGTLAAVGFAAVYTFPWRPGLNHELALQRLAPEEQVTEPA